MPKPTCVQCNTNDSLLWRSAENGQICNECHLLNTANKEIKSEATVKVEHEVKEEKEDSDSKNGKNESESTPAKATGKGTRKSTRSTRYKPKTPAPTPAKPPAPRGRGRRSIFKRQPVKAPTATATVVTSDSVFYQVLLGHSFALSFKVNEPCSILYTSRGIATAVSVVSRLHHQTLLKNLNNTE